KQQARERGVFDLCVRKAPNGNLRFLGVDLAIKVGEHHDLTAMFGFEVLPTGHRQILCIEYGRWDLATKISKVSQLQDAFRFDLVLVEDNAAQALFVEQTLRENVAMPVKGS